MPVSDWGLWPGYIQRGGVDTRQITYLTFGWNFFPLR